MRKPGPGSEIPGLRLDWVSGADRSDGPDYHLVHLPTGARMTVTAQRRTSFTDRRIAGQPWPAGYAWWTTETALTSDEQDQIMDLVTPPNGVAAIVSALVVRMRARDPQGQWAMGNWWNDPLQRPGHPCSCYRSNRRLMPGGRHWLLEWCGYPYAADVAAMLSDSEFGLIQATITSGEAEITIAVDGDALRLKTCAPDL